MRSMWLKFRRLSIFKLVFVCVSLVVLVQIPVLLTLVHQHEIADPQRTPPRAMERRAASVDHVEPSPPTSTNGSTFPVSKQSTKRKGLKSEKKFNLEYLERALQDEIEPNTFLHRGISRAPLQSSIDPFWLHEHFFRSSDPSSTNNSNSAHNDDGLRIPTSNHRMGKVNMSTFTFCFPCVHVTPWQLSPNFFSSLIPSGLFQVEVLFVSQWTTSEVYELVTLMYSLVSGVSLGKDGRVVFESNGSVVWFRFLSVLQGDRVRNATVSMRSDLARFTWELMPMLISVTRADPDTGFVLFLSPFVVPYISQINSKKFSPDVLLDAVVRSEPNKVVVSCRVAAPDVDGDLITIANGLGVALGEDDEPRIFERDGGFSVHDARQQHRSTIFGPSPHCFLSPLSTMFRYWPRPVDGRIVPWTVTSTPSKAFPFSIKSELPSAQEFLAGSMLLRVEHAPFFRFLFQLHNSQSKVSVVTSTATAILLDQSTTKAIVLSSSFAGVHPTTLVTPSNSVSTKVKDPMEIAFCWWRNVSLHAGRPLADSTGFIRDIFVEWETFCIPCFGFSNEVMHFVKPLENKIAIRILNEPRCFCSGTPFSFQGSLERLYSRRNRWRNNHDEEDPWTKGDNKNTKNILLPPNASLKVQPPKSVTVRIIHKDPGSFPPRGVNPPTLILIGRSMYEFTVLPSHWLSHENAVDEIWVPSMFVRWVFVKNGFSEKSIVVIPEPIDVHYYNPDAVQPIPLPYRGWNCASNVENHHAGSVRRHYKFLSVFKWEERKAWDVLLKAFFSEFKFGVDQVSLYLVTYIYGEGGRNPSKILEKVSSIFASINNLTRTTNAVGPFPHVEIISEELSEDELLSLYRSCDAFVLPTRGEGWGLPAIQAMAMAMPTIVTNWSGVLDFATADNSFLIPVERLESVPSTSPYGSAPGKLWAQPSVNGLRKLLRYVYMNPTLAKEVGARARANVVSYFSEEAVSLVVLKRLVQLRKNRLAKLRADEFNARVHSLLEAHHLQLS